MAEVFSKRIRLQHPPSVKLAYSISDSSEHSSRYAPANILLDHPTDQASRWSTAYQTSNVKQYILLRLDSPSVVKTITFGKYCKPHPCNMREFRIYVGMTEHHMIEVLNAGLKNDSIPETFSVKHINSAGVVFPACFVKIIPLSAHGQAFHTSIWFVSMSGVVEQQFVEQVRINYEQYLENTTLLHILKHLRKRRLLTPYKSLLSRTSIQLEHPLITSLYEQLVLQGSFPFVDRTLQTISESGLFDSYLYSCQPHMRWERLYGADADGDMPSKRSGHAMCIDDENGIIYLLGGWNGQENLDDFWAYDTKEDRWRLLSHSTSEEKNGPGRRSCHKMVFDEKTGCIYVLGRMGDGEVGNQEVQAGSPASVTGGATDRNVQQREETLAALCSEFYRYHTRGLDVGNWDLLSFDTASSGGPPLIFDHQMVIDSESQMLYVFGGRLVEVYQSPIKYSGMYSYNVRTSKWKMMQSADSTKPSHEVSIPPRSGHSMVLEPTTHTLFIFAGQREDKYLSDMYAYHIDTDTVSEIFSSYTANSGPEPCFTQRAVIDPDLREIYVFCGLSKQSPGNQQIVIQSKSPYWLYRYPAASCDEKGKWMKLLLPEDLSRSDERYYEEEIVPKPRYAHQLVYSWRTKTTFMHGGNAGLQTDGEATEPDADQENKEDKEMRLDDFWCMRLERPPRESLLRKVMFEVKRQQFREMCEDGPAVQALNFLQTEVSALVDPNDLEQERAFQSLLSHLVGESPRISPTISPTKADRDTTTLVASSDGEDVIADIDRDSEDLLISSSDSSRIRSALTMEEDPEEQALRGQDRIVLSAERFKQRTEVFERLLTFVNEESKQPEGALLHVIDRDEPWR